MADKPFMKVFILLSFFAFYSYGHGTLSLWESSLKAREDQNKINASLIKNIKALKYNQDTISKGIKTHDTIFKSINSIRELDLKKIKRLEKKIDELNAFLGIFRDNQRRLRKDVDKMIYKPEPL